MAKKKKNQVNTKFAVILGVAIIVLCGAVVGGAYLVLSKSAEDSKKEAEAALAAGDKEKAMALAGRAVAKEMNNLDYLKYWVSLMEMTQPVTQQSYVERYFLNLVPARQRIADLLRTNIEAHEAIFAPQYQLMVLSRAQPKDWVDFIAGVNKATAKFDDKVPEQAKSKAILNRYRGIARTELMKRAFDMPDAEKVEGRADLEAALKADPTNDQAILAWTEWMQVKADELKADNRLDESKQTLDELRTRLAAFRAASPDAPGAMLAHLRMEMYDISVRGAGKSTRAQLEAQVQPLADEGLKLAERIDVKVLDRTVLMNLTQIALASALPNAYERSKAIWSKIAEGSPQDPEPKFQIGALAMAASQYDDAIKAMQSVAEMPDLPLSLNGILLFERRRTAREMQAMAALIMVDKTPAEQRDAAMTRLKGFRDAFAKEARTGDTALLLLDGRIAVLNNDLVGARMLLGQYNDQTNRTNVDAMMVLAQVMMRQGAMGAAQTLLYRVTELEPNASNAWRLLTEVQLRLPDYPGALRSVTRAETLEPTSEDLKRQKKLIADLVAGVKADDPIMKALAEAQVKLDAIPQDLEGAKAILKKAAEKPDGLPTQLVALSAALAFVGEVELATKLIDDGLIKNPDDKYLQARKAAMTQAAAPPKTVQERINESDMGPFEKAMSRYMDFTRTGQTEEATKAFAEAKSLQPDHPLVLSAEFEAALRDGKIDDARRMVAKAKETDADRAKGAIFEARFEATQGRLPEAIAIIRRAAEADPLNPVTWRLLGQLNMNAGKYADAVSAMERSVNIKPDDAESVYGLARAKLAVGAPMEALKVCRGAQLQAARSAELMNLWLELEMQLGDANLALDKRRRMFEAVPKDRVNGGAYLRMLLADKEFDKAKAVIEKIDAEGWGDQINPLRALWWASQGKNAEARKIFDDLLAKVPLEDRQRIGPWIGFARAMADLNAIELAIGVLNDARSLQSKEGMEIDREIGDIYFSRGMHKEAMEAYQRALDSVTKDENNLLAQRIAECCIRTGDLPRAQAVLEKAVPTGDEEKFRLLLLKAEVLSAQGKYVEARPLLDDAVATQKDNWLGYYKRAECNYREPALIKDAMADLEQALRLNPEAIRARQLLAGLHVADGQADRGITLLRDGLSQDPGNEELRMALITGLVRLGRVKDGILLAEDAFEKNQQLRWAGMAADLHAQTRSWNSAARFYGELWKRDPKPAVAVRYVPTLMNSTPADIAAAKAVLSAPGIDVEKESIFRMLRAWVAMRDNRPKDAETDAIAAWLLIDTTSMKEVAAYMQSLLQMYAKPTDTTARLDESIAITRTRLMPEKSSDVVEFQVAILMNGDPKQRVAAQAEFERLLTEAKSPQVKVASSRLVGNQAYEQKNYAKAAEVYKRGLEADPNDAELLNNAGYCLSKHLGKPEEGLPLVKRAVELSPNNPDMLDSYGSVLMMVNRVDEAEPVLRQARAAATSPFGAAAPTIHLIEVKLAKKDRSAADQLMRELRTLIEKEAQPKRIEQVYREDIDRVQQSLQGGG